MYQEGSDHCGLAMDAISSISFRNWLWLVFVWKSRLSSLHLYEARKAGGNRKKAR